MFTVCLLHLFVLSKRIAFGSSADYYDIIQSVDDFLG